MGRRKKPEAMKVGTLRWDSYQPGKHRLYQLQKVTTTRGGISALSGRMRKAQARAFAEGWNKAKGRRGKRIPKP